ncbi:MAG TPA: HAD-IA family hydrolase [Acidimicrobiales bacterium]|nr:HAD-IA family hydrolase [Acidimicrobiales bacterium]
MAGWGVPRLVTSVGALIFDLDGVLIHSVDVAKGAWEDWALRVGVDPDEILPSLHGTRPVDAVRRWAPHLDAEREVQSLVASELNQIERCAPMPGAGQLLRQLPSRAWGVVTSSNRRLAEARLCRVVMPLPDVLICAEDVGLGKPSPEGYLAASRLLGQHPGSWVGVEDSPLGLRAIKAAGGIAVALRTTHSDRELQDAVLIVDDLSFLDVKVEVRTGAIEVGPREGS